MGRLLGSDSGLVTALRGAAQNRPLMAGLVVAVPTFVLYWRTVMPDVGFWDTAEFQAIGPVLGIAHPTGYPTYTLLAWLASVLLQPFGNEALRANLLSSFAVAIAMGLVAATVTRLTRRWLIGVATAAALGVSAQVWSIGVRADPHALHLMFAALLIWLLVVWQDRVTAAARADRWLFAAAVVFGISMANHALTYLLAPGIAIFVLVVQPRILLRPRLIAACLLGLIVSAAAIYAYLPIRSAMNPPMDYANPETWEGFRYLVFAEQFRGTFQALPAFGDALRTIVDETLAQLGIFAVLAVVGLLVTAWRRPALMLLLAAWFGVNWLFALGYINADIGRYYLVPLLSAAILGGLGAGAIIDWAADQLTNLTTNRPQPGMRTAGAATATILGIVLVAAAVLPVPGRFASQDASAEIGGRRWLDGTIARLEPNAVVISWWSYSTTLWYGVYVQHLRPDITVIDDSTITQHQLGNVQSVIDTYLGQRPVYVIRVSYDLPQIEAQYVLTPVSGIVGGPVFRVDGMKASSGEVART